MATPGPACEQCELANRRDFLRDTLAAVAAAFATFGVTPVQAAALGVRFARGIRVGSEEHSYPIPAADGATIDKENEIILVRFEQKVYAFNLSCPHQNTALRWNPDEAQFQCPKHHSRYRPDGIFVSGRATRSMDRLGVRRDAGNVVVNADQFYRQDKNPTEWAAAVLAL
jgi:Rieske Fe-S protein